MPWVGGGNGTHPKCCAFFDDGRQLGETDVHGQVPGLPGEREQTGTHEALLTGSPTGALRAEEPVSG